MRHGHLITLAVLTAAMALPQTGWADVFTLVSGGQVVGQLLNPDQIPRETYEIETADGIVVTLDRRQVASRDYTRPALEEYHRIKPEYPDTIRGQLELAEWCRENNLYTQRKEHLRRVIEIEPNHSEARTMLGYMKTERGWMTRDELMASRGYVKRGSRYYLPQELELMETREKVDRAEKEWFQKIRMWRGWCQPGNQRQMLGIERLKSIDDPMALPAIKQNLEEETDPSIRLLYLFALAKMDSIEANGLLVHTYLTDGHREVQLTALDHLLRDPQPETKVAFIRSLRSKDVDAINRSAYALQELKVHESVGPLIESLLTQQKFKVTIGNPGGMSTTFGGMQGSGGNALGGISGMSAGSSTKIVTRVVQNQGVLEALVNLTGVNYGYDIAGWKTWFAAQKTPPSLDARRD